MFTIAWDQPAFDQMNALILWYPLRRRELAAASGRSTANFTGGLTPGAKPEAPTSFGSVTSAPSPS